MFSKNVLKKMVQELTVPTLIAVAHESLDNISGEEVTEAALDAVSNIELVAAELKRRGPQPITQPVQTNRRRNGSTDKTPDPEVQERSELQ